MSIFTFKQFVVNQSQSAMKVGTDSVLLGCLAQANHPKNILDIGTGTGLLALMMAQRFEGAHIDAVEIDAASALESAVNFSQSKWAKQLQLFHQSFQQFVKNSAQPYQLIISNPPYYKVAHNITIPNTQRAHARQDATLPLTEFLEGVYSVLALDGQCWVVLPKQEGEVWLELLPSFGFYATTQILIIPKEGKDPNRLILCFGKIKPNSINQLQFTIYETNGTYTAAYKNLTEPFLLWLNQTR